MAGTHARLSASSSERWIECPGSQVRADLLAPDTNEETEFAAEGSCAHEGAAIALRDGLEGWACIGQKLYTDAEGKVWEFTPEMAEHVQVYLDYIRGSYGAIGESDIETMVEEKIVCAELGDDFGGTADCVKYRLFTGAGASFIHIFDFKYGVGIHVEVKDNTQLMYYAYGILRKLGIARGDNVRVGMTIVQPRDKVGDPIREHWTNSDDLLDWAEIVLIPAMQRTKEADAELKPGAHCRFCPAKLNCPAMTGMLKGAAEADPLSIPQMTDERLALEYELIGPVKFYLRAIEDEAYRRALAGNPVPGTHLTPGRADRKWKDGAEAVAVERFGDAAYSERKVLSPAQIEKQCVGGKEFVAEYAYKPDAAPILKPIKAGGKTVAANFGGAAFAGVKIAP